MKGFYSALNVKERRKKVDLSVVASNKAFKLRKEANESVIKAFVAKNLPKRRWNSTIKLPLASPPIKPEIINTNSEKPQIEKLAKIEFFK